MNLNVFDLFDYHQSDDLSDLMISDDDQIDRKRLDS